MKFLRVVLLSLLLAACSPIPMVNTNAQVGAENTQVLGQQTKYEVSSANKVEQGQTNKVQIEKVEKVTYNETSWVITLFLVLGWLMPSPNEISRVIRGVFSGRKKL